MHVDKVAKKVRTESLGPGPCEGCLAVDDDVTFREWGCGWKPKHRGKALPMGFGAGDFDRFGPDEKIPEEGRTCPWFFAGQPFVESIEDLIEDYEKGRLGNALLLPAPLAFCLRVLSNERKRWDAEMDRIVRDG